MTEGKEARTWQTIRRPGITDGKEARTWQTIRRPGNDGSIVLVYVAHCVWLRLQCCFVTPVPTQRRPLCCFQHTYSVLLGVDPLGPGKVTTLCVAGWNRLRRWRRMAVMSLGRSTWSADIRAQALWVSLKTVCNFSRKSTCPTERPLSLTL